MKTVKEVSEMTGISIRTLRYYDQIGLLPPTAVSEAGYRLYDEKALEKLQQIMFFRELEIPLADIKAILDAPDFDQKQALEIHRVLLERKRNRLNGILELLNSVIAGTDTISFEAFSDAEVEQIIGHSIEMQSPESLEAIEKEFGSLEAFSDCAGKQLKAQTAHYVKVFGSRKKAVEAHLNEPLGTGQMEELKEENDRIYQQFARAKETQDNTLAMDAVKKLEEYNKKFLRVDNSRYLMLKIAKDYLQEKNYPELIAVTNQKYGEGTTEYIGQAIAHYYGMEDILVPQTMDA